MPKNINDKWNVAQKKMSKVANKTRRQRAVTLIELIIAVAMITIIFAVVVPQFVILRKGWDVKQGAAEVIQNGRVMVDHIGSNLSKASRIAALGTSSIDFNDCNGIMYRYDIGGNNYVRFGPVGSPADLAGPVSSMQFTCYDACDLNTPITDVNLIRTVKVTCNITNPNISGGGKTFTVWAYLRTNQTVGDIVGCWKLDETSGTTAADSTGYGNNGTVITMNPPTGWTTGQIDGALRFDGGNNYVSLPIGSVINSLTNCTISSWVNWSGSGSSWQRIWDFGTGQTCNMFLTPNNGDTGSMRFAITINGSSSEDRTTVAGSSPLSIGWHHVAVTIDADHHTHTLYLDGTSVAQNTSAYRKPSDLGITTQNYLGKSNYSYNPYFIGTLDEVRIYNRVLTATEIAALTNILRYRDFREYKAGYFLTEAHVATPPSNAGDLLIAAVATYGDTSSSLSAPSGWTLLDCGAADDGAVTLGVWRKIAGASEPSDNCFKWSGNRQAYGWIMRFTGQAATNPINASSTGGTFSSTPTSPAVTTTVNNCIILRLGAFKGDDIVVDSPGLPGHSVITMDESCDTNKPITYGGFSEAKLSSDGNSITVAKPDNTVQGNLLIAAVATDGNTWGNLSAPSGWNPITTWAGGPYTFLSVTLGAWYKTAGVSEPNYYMFSWPASIPEQAYGWIMRFSGTNIAYSGWPAPTYGTSSLPPCGSSTPGPPGAANVITLRLGAFKNDTITIDSPGLSDHNVITMDRSNTGSGSVSGGAGYMNGYNTASNFSLTSSQAYVTTSPCIWPNGSYSNTCSGGAGYIRQYTAGSSGTSNFTLTAPNEARMVTIGIAPASGVSCCDNQTRP